MVDAVRCTALFALTLLAACSDPLPAGRVPASSSTASSALAINPSLVSLSNAAQESLTPAERENVVGAAVFRNTCALCHGPGIAGAPRLDNAKDWAPRLARGREQLHAHALGGYAGNSGLMPAKGGNPALTDEEVRAAVDFMLSRAASLPPTSASPRG